MNFFPGAHRLNPSISLFQFEAKTEQIHRCSNFQKDFIFEGKKKGLISCKRNQKACIWNLDSQWLAQQGGKLKKKITFEKEKIIRYKKEIIDIF